MTTAYIGIDLHRTVIQICVLDGRGEIVAQERLHHASLAEGLRAVEVVKRFAPVCRVAVEALGLNRWFVNACLAAGIAVLVCDARKLGLHSLGKKTNVRDAREIARRLWLGDLDRMARTYYPSDAEYGRRKLLRVRHHLVQMRQQTTNQLRAMLNAYQLEAPRIGCVKYVIALVRRLANQSTARSSRAASTFNVTRARERESARSASCSDEATFSLATWRWRSCTALHTE